MLFAAGFGTRMRPLTLDRPKPLIPVAGRALLDHALDLAHDAGGAPIVVNAHYRAAQIEAHCADRAGVTVTVEAPDILDTGGGLKAALPLLQPPGGGAGPVATLNTDAVWTGVNPFETLRAAWDDATMDALLLLVPVARAGGHGGPGDFAMAGDGRLSRGAGYVFTGAQMIRPGMLHAEDAAVFSLNRVWDRAARQGRLRGVVHDGGWCDVGRPENIATAEAMLAAEGRAS